MSLTSPDPVPDAYCGARVLVLGATGFIGRRLAGRLAAAGAHVLASARDATALRALSRATPEPLDIAPCDLLDDDALARLIARAEPDMVFNLAGYGVDRTEKAEAVAFRLNAAVPAVLVRLLDAHARPGWRGQVLVHAGSALEYGLAGNDLSEDTEPAPTTVYGRSKLAGTTAIAVRSQASGLRALTARLFTVYGPGEHAGRLLPSLLECARTRVPLPLTAGSQRRDFTFVDDVVEGLLRLGLADAAPGTIVNLATGELESVRGFVERAARVLGIEPGLLHFNAVASHWPEMTHAPVAIARLVALTGWRPATGIEAGVERTARELHAAVHAGGPQ